MKINELGSKKLFKEFLIEIPYNEVDNSINKKINDIISTVTIPGFRKGKAPLNIVRKKYENNILGEVIENIVQIKTKELLEKKKLTPFRQPKVEIKKYIKNEPVELSIKIDLQPNIKLNSFKNFKTNKYKINIDSKSYKDNYETYIKSQKIFSKLSKNRTAKKGDRIIVDINSQNKLVPDFLRSQTNVTLLSDSDYQILPDISNKLINTGVKIGDKTNIKFDLKNILKTEKKILIEFLIEIKNIEEQKDFIVDQDFLSKNNFKTEKDFRNKIDQVLKNEYENYLREIEKKQLMDMLEKNYEFDIPEGIFEEEFSIIWQRVEKAKKNNQLDQDDKDLTDQQLRKRYEKIASRRVKLAILMQKIANENSISTTEQELTNGMINYASQYPGQEKQIFEYFKKNTSKIESIRGPILENKIIEHILSNSTNKNISISIKEFKKLQENTFSLNKETQ